VRGARPALAAATAWECKKAPESHKKPIKSGLSAGVHGDHPDIEIRSKIRGLGQYCPAVGLVAQPLEGQLPSCAFLSTPGVAESSQKLFKKSGKKN
jgi:hypothetical protein